MTLIPLIFSVARVLHIAAGVLAFSTFLIPLIAKKGGKTHRRAGWAYVAASAALAITGVFNCVAWLTDDRPANDSFAVFLLYVAVLGASTAMNGVRALRTKKPRGARRVGVDVVLPGLLVLGGAALAVFGATHGTPLFVIFAMLGAFLGVTELRFWLRPPATKHEWFFAHMGGMGASCITTLTAFLVVNARHLGLGTFNLVVWIAPGVIGGIGLTLWTRYYRRRMGGGVSAAAAE